MKPFLLHYLKELRAFGMANNIPNVTRAVGQFLNMIIRIQKPESILEIGCANGYSTIWMAEAAKVIGAKIHTIDHSRPTFEQAQKNLLEVDLSEVVHFYFGKAQSILTTMDPDLAFDLVFVDGEKAAYLDFWNLIQPRLKPGAVIVFDDMMAFPQKTGAFYEMTKTFTDFDSLLFPIDEKDGILMMVKK